MGSDPVLQLAAAATVEVLNSSVNLNSTSLFSKADYATDVGPSASMRRISMEMASVTWWLPNTGSGSLSILRNTSVAGSVSLRPRWISVCLDCPLH